jgi:hypothetical protein
MKLPEAHPRSWPRAFTLPAWWLALALLLLNDHLWKHNGALPSLITGKLSDFTGMLVAPPLVAYALGTGRAAARIFALLWVGLCFALLKLSPPAAHAAEAWLSLLGLSARICPDPSDLWALLVLPAALPLCRPAPQPLKIRKNHIKVQRAALAIASFACLATSGLGGSNSKDDRSDAPAIKNGSSSALTLILSSTDGAGGCSIYRDDRVSILTGNAFAATRTVTLNPGAQASLPRDTATTTCGAASIGLSDGSETFVLWRDLDKIESFVPADDAQRLARLAVVTSKAGMLHIDLGDDLTRFDLGGDPPTPTCKEPALSYTLEVSALSQALGFLKLGEVRTAQDGCLEADWFMDSGDTSPETQRLCVPSWAFPFQADERLAVAQELGPAGERTLRVTRFSGNTIDTQLVIWIDASEFGDGEAQSLKASDCVGSLTSCGAYVRSALVNIRGKKDAIAAGSELTLKGSAPKETHLLIGPARDVGWTAATCEGGEARVGPSASLLELRTY